MKKRRRRHVERAVEQKLPRSGNKQIGSTNHFGNPHRGVIDNHGELIGRHAIVPPDYEITEVFSCDERLWAKRTIIE